MNFFQIAATIILGYQIATISLVIQLVILGLLLGGWWLKTAKKFRQHGITMLAAVVLHAIMVFAWMIPVFSTLFSSPGSINLADMFTVIILVHAVTGIAATILGIWIVASWRLQANMKTCFAKKRVMLVTITLWLIALVIGIYLYLRIIQPF
jgi:uncharacterized membrane protein YozB (DUF420 family)